MNILATNRFRLEIINENHYSSLKEIALDESLWIYSTIRINSEIDFKKYFDQALLMANETTQRVYVVYDIESQNYVGMTRIYAFDSTNKSAKIGFTWYASSVQGSGVNLHSKYLILKLAFEELAIERIELNADLRNKRSIAAMNKIGFIEEGILRQSIYLPDGHKRDTIIFSLLKDEWFRSVKENLINKL